MEEKSEPLNKFEISQISNKNSKSKKPIIIGLLIIMLIIFLVLGILIFYLFAFIDSKTEETKEDENDKNNNYPEYIEISPLMFGATFSNISYANNNKIKNSFKINGDNYKKELGNINKGNDYNETDRNTYTLYVPYSSIKNNDKYNGIILFIHGDLWTKGNKEYLTPLAEIYSQSGYVTAIMDYTLLTDNYKEYNIFRILDEISACIESISQKLINEGLTQDKLEIALGGYSAGAHLALLYSYSVKKTPLPIKFIIDISGPVTLEPKYWKKMSDDNETLNNIEPEEIIKALNESKIIDAIEDDYFLLNLMNIFLGKKYSDEELNTMMENKKIIENNEKYQELLNNVKYAFPTEYSNNNTIPTLCIYGGNDTLIGVAQYAYLKSLSNKIENKLVLIYSKYSNHYVINFNTQNGIDAMREMHYQILNFAKLYFSYNL